MTIADLRPLMQTAAAEFGLTAQLVEAVVLQESLGNTFAYNPEPKYRWFWDVKKRAPFRKVSDAEVAAKFPPPDFRCLAGDPDQEWWAQQASWGLMQVMGAVAREEGFPGSFIPELTDPAVGLRFGCKHLKSRLEWAHGDLSAALACYNGGPSGNAPGTQPLRNAKYADDVLGRLATLAKTLHV